MATTGVTYKLNDREKQQAIKYVEVSGFYKNRLAFFLSISRPTLDRILEDDKDFFTQVQRADANFCKDLILSVKKKNPSFLLKTRYKEEFGENRLDFDPQAELKRVEELIYGKSAETN
ncbi:MAG TPA: hypothetical protein PLS49_04210 [Candidatus Woesebacteria bacterium]|nr:hypothetical protein [Candidatus Woesebacteria bacterium]